MLVLFLSNFRCYKKLNFWKGGSDDFPLIAHPILNRFKIGNVGFDRYSHAEVHVKFCSWRLSFFCFIEHSIFWLQFTWSVLRVTLRLHSLLLPPWSTSATRPKRWRNELTATSSAIIWRGLPRILGSFFSARTWSVSRKRFKMRRCWRGLTSVNSLICSGEKWQVCILTTTQHVDSGMEMPLGIVSVVQRVWWEPRATASVIWCDTAHHSPCHWVLWSQYCSGRHKFLHAPPHENNNQNLRFRFWNGWELGVLWVESRLSPLFRNSIFHSGRNCSKIARASRARRVDSEYIKIYTNTWSYCRDM